MKEDNQHSLTLNVDSKKQPEPISIQIENSPKQVRVTHLLSLLSFALGMTGTYLTIRSETAGDNLMPTRVWYAFILALAGVLIESVRSSESRIFSVTQPVQMNEDELSALKLSDEKKRDEPSQELSAVTEQAGDPSDIQEELKSPTLEMVNLPAPLKEMPESRHSSVLAMQKIRESIINAPTYWRHWSVDISSAIWLSQAGYLLIRNVIQESAHSSLLPYSTLIGLATGHLFSVSIQLWPLWGMRDWIQHNCNKAAAFEYMLFFMLPPIIKKNLSLYYYLTAALWSGFNLSPLVSLATDKLFKKNKQSTRADHKMTPPKESSSQKIPYRHRPRDFLICLSGLAIATTSILLLNVVSADRAGLRNLFVQLLGGMGCYGMTYPLGVYLGHKIPSRYDGTILSTCIYLLVPLASPDLSILHYLGMMGAGLCGGISEHILDSQYIKQLAQMRTQLGKIQAMITKSPDVFQWLITLPLPPDELLLIQRKKRLKFRWIARILCLVLLISALATQSLWRDYPIVLFITILSITVPVMTVSILPKYTPSIYNIYRSSFVQRFVYTNSFTFGYLVKIVAFICIQNLYNAHGQLALLSESNTPKIIFSANLLNICAMLMMIKSANIQFNGGYSPYLPATSEIFKLRKLLNNQRTLTLNYHLLQFMKENIRKTKVNLARTGRLNNHPLKTIRKEKKEETNYCQHPLNQLSLFAAPRETLINTSSGINPLSPFPLATLECQGCQQITSVQVGFTHADQHYTEQRFDTAFNEAINHAVFRGAAIAHQFQFGLPAGLSLTSSINRFSF